MGYTFHGHVILMCIISFSEMDESLDVSGIEESIHVAHSCECGYFTRDRSNYNRHIKNASGIVDLDRQQALRQKRSVTAQLRKKLQPVQQVVSSRRLPEVSSQRSALQDSRSFVIRAGNYGMKLHIKSKHAMEFKHKCSMCDKTFNQTVQYRYHCSTHLNVQIDRCPHCKACFSSHGSLGRHLKTCSMNKDSKIHSYSIFSLAQYSKTRKYPHIFQINWL